MASIIKTFLGTSSLSLRIYHTMPRNALQDASIEISLN